MSEASCKGGEHHVPRPSNVVDGASPRWNMNEPLSSGGDDRPVLVDCDGNRIDVCALQERSRQCFAMLHAILTGAGGSRARGEFGLTSVGSEKRRTGISFVALYRGWIDQNGDASAPGRLDDGLTDRFGADPFA